VPRDSHGELSEGLVKFGLWCLRRPLLMWFVLLWGILTFIGPTRFLLSHWHEAIEFLSPEQFIHALIVPGLALSASVLAFCMRKESVALLAIYFGLYFIVVWQMQAPRPWQVIAFNLVLGVAVLGYLLWLLRARRLR